MLVTNLNPKFSKNKSYYGKAQVITLDNGVLILKSYDTVVCIVLPENEDCEREIILPWFSWSQTTGKHVWDFLLQNGIKPDFDNLQFKNFAQFMRGIGQFTWHTVKRNITDWDDSTWVCNLQKLDKAIDNYKVL